MHSWWLINSPYYAKQNSNTDDGIPVPSAAATPCRLHPSLQSTSGFGLMLWSRCIQSDKPHIDNQTLCSRCLFLCVHTNDETLIYELGPAETNRSNVPWILETLASNLFSRCSYVVDFLSHLKEILHNISLGRLGGRPLCSSTSMQLEAQKDDLGDFNTVLWDCDSWFHNPNDHGAEWAGHIYRVDALDQWKRYVPDKMEENSLRCHYTNENGSRKHFFLVIVAEIST